MLLLKNGYSTSISDLRITWTRIVIRPPLLSTSWKRQISPGLISASSTKRFQQYMLFHIFTAIYSPMSSHVFIVRSSSKSVRGIVCSCHSSCQRRHVKTYALQKYCSEKSASRWSKEMVLNLWAFGYTYCAWYLKLWTHQFWLPLYKVCRHHLHKQRWCRSYLWDFVRYKRLLPLS